MAKQQITFTSEVVAKGFLAAQDSDTKTFCVVKKMVLEIDQDALGWDSEMYNSFVESAFWFQRGFSWGILNRYSYYP